MSALTSLEKFRYPFPSDLILQDRNRVLRLATFHQEKGKNVSPFFFEGKLANPKRTAELLRSLMKIVQSRFHIPSVMLSRIIGDSDPVVTSNDGVLRFEGFSACAGVYTRLDLNPDAFDGEATGRGTTNVDFNAPMLAALARVKKNDDIGLSVGVDQVVLKKARGDVVEKKVALPVRWLKGFVEVQAVQSRMVRRHTVSGLEAFRFFRSLPRMKTHRRRTYISPSGKGLRLSQIEIEAGVVVGGLERLQVLENLAKDSNQLEVYSDVSSGASGWVLRFDDCTFHLVVSPEVWRGFSGEGQALASIARKNKSELQKVRALLQWQNTLNSEALSKKTKIKRSVIDESLMVLGARGLVGYDLATQAYFHREMPFDVSQVEKFQPRLKSARKLLENESLTVRNSNDKSIEVLVPSRNVNHRVVLTVDGVSPEKCTCPWFSQHQANRGPCKYLLAAQMFIEEKEADS